MHPLCSSLSPSLFVPLSLSPLSFRHSSSLSLALIIHRALEALKGGLRFPGVHDGAQGWETGRAADDRRRQRVREEGRGCRGKNEAGGRGKGERKGRACMGVNIKLDSGVRKREIEGVKDKSFINRRPFQVSMVNLNIFLKVRGKNSVSVFARHSNETVKSSITLQHKFTCISIYIYYQHKKSTL